MTDPISDMLTRIRNGALARKSEVLVPYSTLKAKLAAVLVREGYVAKVSEVDSPYRSLVIGLSYQNGQPKIKGIKRISKPGLRRYVKVTELPNVLSGLGIAVVSTSQGLMTNKEAKKKSLGGELLCEIF